MVWVSGAGSWKHLAAYMVDFGAKNSDIGPQNSYFGSLFKNINIIGWLDPHLSPSHDRPQPNQLSPSQG